MTSAPTNLVGIRERCGSWVKDRLRRDSSRHIICGEIMIDDLMCHGVIAAPRCRARIEHDTPIVPKAVAEAVWEEASVWLDEELPRAWIGELMERANVIYAHNRRFGQTIRRKGNTGRDCLWAFTRHWLAALLWKHRRELHARLPDSYNVGHSLPKAPPRTPESTARYTSIA